MRSTRSRWTRCCHPTGPAYRSFGQLQLPQSIVGTNSAWRSKQRIKTRESLSRSPAACGIPGRSTSRRHKNNSATFLLELLLSTSSSPEISISSQISSITSDSLLNILSYGRSDCLVAALQISCSELLVNLPRMYRQPSPDG